MEAANRCYSASPSNFHVRSHARFCLTTYSCRLSHVPFSNCFTCLFNFFSYILLHIELTIDIDNFTQNLFNTSHARGVAFDLRARSMLT